MYKSDFKKIIQDNEFRVKEGIANIETAFLAGYGKCVPVIGILGEFDALPNLSQVLIN